VPFSGNEYGGEDMHIAVRWQIGHGPTVFEPMRKSNKSRGHRMVSPSTIKLPATLILSDAASLTLWDICVVRKTRSGGRIISCPG
jgi:hypothetical protein